MANTIISTAETLSVNSSPGQDVRFPNTSSESVFTFGDFRLERAAASESLGNPESSASFSSFVTLESLSSVTFNAQEVVATTANELNPRTNDPQSYSYFGSFYTKVASSINSVIENFPYAMLASSTASANTIFNYSKNDFANTSTFQIPISAITNQGGVIFASGVTDTDNVLTLFNEPEQFGIQISGDTANTRTYTIIAYSYSTGTTGTLNFTLDGILLTGATTATTSSVYIRPSPQRYGQYQRTTSHLDNQLLFDGSFRVPDPDDDSLFVTSTFTWPKTIDGFNPDLSGPDFDQYSADILAMAQRVDDSKTNWLVRTMIPENYLELDTDSQIYQKLISVYAEEFDRIKQYIDALAFAHTITYDAQENIPDKFIHRLSTLLGFKFHDAFTDSDIFEYLASEDDDGKTFSDYNLELWRRILVSINWMYKKKGTRDAITFIFKLVGAPDCLINFNEFVYKINRSVSHDNNNKINSQGFPNYEASEFIFQEGGEGRGNGKAYINQWSPEFEPLKTVDNVKVYTADTIFGTQDTMNTKEVDINLDPASAIECDLKSWLSLGYGTWLWGSTATTFSPYSILPLSGITVPFEWLIDNVSGVTPSSITGMTMSQWLDFVYASNVNPTNRKTYGKGQVQGVYHDLKRVYMTYMLWTNGQVSNRLTVERLGKFLDLIERNFFGYLPQFLPATTIFDAATVYRNSLFNRQKFVYEEGINRGSEFQRELPPQPEAQIDTFKITPHINEIIHPDLLAVNIHAVANDIIDGEIDAVTVTSRADTGTQLVFPTFTAVMDVNVQVDLLVPTERKFAMMPIVFPAPITIITASTING